MNSVEIIVGHRWTEDVRYIDSLRPRRPAETSLNLLELRDIIDIVVDGSNLTASIPEEAIFGLVASVLADLVELVDQKSQKAIVEFHHEPWELVMVPDGSTLFISLYSIDRRRQVVARDLQVDVHQFVDAICGAGEQLLTELFRVSDRFSSDHQVRQISKALARLRRAPRIELKHRHEVHDSPPHLATTSSAEGLTLGYRLDSADAGLNNYRGEHIFDLHSLLFTGTLEAEIQSQPVILSGDYPFLAIMGLLDRTRQLFNQLESHAHAPFVLDEPLAHLGIEIEGQGSRWTLRLQGSGDQQWHQTTLAPSDCLDILVSLAEMFVRDLRQINSHLDVNHRFIDFCDEVEKLRQWYRDLCGNNLYHDRPEDYLRRLGHIEPRTVSGTEPPDFPRPLASIHTLFPRRRWTLRDERIDFESLVLTQQSVLLSTSDAVQKLDIEDGTPRWRCDMPSQPAHDGFLPLCDKRIVTPDEHGDVAVIDTTCGEVDITLDTEASLDTEAQWSQLQSAAHYDEQGLIVAGRPAGEIVGFDDQDGTPQFRHSVGPAELFALLFSGPLVCAQTTEGVVKALNPRSGETLWKIRLGGTPRHPIALHQGRLYAVVQQPLHRGSTVVALYPFTGRTVWQLQLPGSACGHPSFIDHWMILPVERHGQLSLVGIDLEAVDPQPNWRLELSSAGIDRPTEVLPAIIDDRLHGLVRTDRAELTCFAVDDGSIRWRSMPASETLLLHGNLPLFRIRDAVISVTRTVDIRQLDTGKLLHSFSAIEAPKFGFLATPFCLLLGEKAPDDDIDDRLTAWSIQHFLALVE